jgi:hypothetical protein
MKKLIFILLLTQGIQGKIFSQILDENFDYNVGDSLQQHSWSTIGSVFTNRIIVTAPGLSFPLYINSGYGNSATIDTTGQDVYKDFTSPKTSGNVYASFLADMKTAKSAGDYFVTFLSSTSTTSLAGRVYAKDSSGFIAFGLSKSTEAVQYTPARYFKDSTYLIILKYAVNAGTLNDSVSLFVYSASNTVPSSEPIPDIGPKGGSGADLTDVGRFCLRQGTSSSAPRVVIDGIYITTSWDNSALPVEMESFTSVTNENNVKLLWSTATEINNRGFEIERKCISDNSDNEWLNAGNVSGFGNSDYSINYSFSDMGLNTGKYIYRLKQIDFNGNYVYFGLNNDVIINVPGKFELYQNYPNPFNPSTKIRFDLPVSGNVNLKVYSITGKEVAVILNEMKTAGYYSVNFNAVSLPSGIYFYSISSGNYFAYKKMMLVK